MPVMLNGFDTRILTETGTAEERISRIADYLYRQAEELRYLLANLGAENFNEKSLTDIKADIVKATREALKSDGVDATLSSDIEDIYQRLRELEEG